MHQLRWLSSSVHPQLIEFHEKIWRNGRDSNLGSSPGDVTSDMIIFLTVLGFQAPGIGAGDCNEHGIRTSADADHD